jgi:ArsR family transcriptional regulator
VNAYTAQARYLKALGHPTRLAILEILRKGEACVCHMQAMLRLRQAYISQQLMLLRQAGLVEVRKDGLNVFYRVTDPSVFAIIDLAWATLSRQTQGHGQAISPPRLPELDPATCPCPECSQRVAIAV